MKNPWVMVMKNDREPDQTAQSLLTAPQEIVEFNYIIVPLNTKISTVAVSLTSMNNSALHVCYAEPETSNFSAYSEPDDKFTMLDIWKQDQTSSEASNV